jgi:uncharacterized membrane protein
MSQFLSSLVEVLFVGSIVYFAVGFVLSVRSGMVRKDAQLQEIAEFMNLPESEWFEAELQMGDQVVPFVRKKALPATRDGMRAIAKSLGIARWSSLSKDALAKVLRTDYGYA